jgi:hypothetical protein
VPFISPAQIGVGLSLNQLHLKGKPDAKNQRSIALTPAWRTPLIDGGDPMAYILIVPL